MTIVLDFSNSQGMNTSQLFSAIDIISRRRLGCRLILVKAVGSFISLVHGLLVVLNELDKFARLDFVQPIHKSVLFTLLLSTYIKSVYVIKTRMFMWMYEITREDKKKNIFIHQPLVALIMTK